MDIFLVTPFYDTDSGTGQVAFLPQMEQCKYCDKVLDVEDMENHILGNHGRFHKGNSKVVCELCCRHIKRIGMKAHLKDKHGIRNYKT